jgi:hypothetical protein
MISDDPVLATIRRLKKRADLPPIRHSVDTKRSFAKRWGPALDDDTNAIVISCNDWRWSAANWPYDRWLLWRERSAELWTESGSIRSQEAIRNANHQAYLEILESCGE